MAENLQVFQSIMSHQRGILEARGFQYANSLAEGLEDESDLTQERAFAIRPISPVLSPGMALDFRLQVVTMLAMHTKRTNARYDSSVQTVSELQNALVLPRNQMRTRSVKGCRSTGKAETVYHSTTLAVYRFQIEYACSIPWE